MPAGLAIQQPKPNKTADASEQSELTISDVFCHQIKLNSGGEDVSDEDVDLVKTREAVAKRILEANVTLTPIPKSEEKANEEITKSAAGRVRGVTGTSAVGVFIDPGVLGEPITAPHNRIPPIPANDVKALD